jgi:hypothetical protein
MRSYWTLNRTKAIVALAGAVVLTGPVIGDKTAFAEKNTDEVAAMDKDTYLTEPGETHPGYMLPPLSDHMFFAQLNDAQFALEEGRLEEEDGTAKGYNRGYYAEPAQIVDFVLVVSNPVEELSNVSDDGTAVQYDRGYYKDPETIVAVIIVSSEDVER